MDDITIEKQDADDYIESLKQSLGKGSCPGHDLQTRVNIWQTRRIADMPKRIEDIVHTEVTAATNAAVGPAIEAAFANGCGLKVAEMVTTKLARQDGRIKLKAFGMDLSFEARDIFRVATAGMIIWIFYNSIAK